MEAVQLERFKITGYLGSGADYEARAATDLSTGEQVVIKRPNPDYIARKLHHSVDRTSEQLIEVHETLGPSIPHIAHLIGYTEIAQHDGYFGDSLTECYRVLVEQRARGLPLVSDIRDKFKGVPIGLGQKLFALYPLLPHPAEGRFPVHRQLIEVEEAFHRAGHLLLDLRPQNVYFEPGRGRITVIDIGTMPTRGPASQGRASRRGTSEDIHDFFAEVFRFYSSPQGPPSEAAGYGEPAGMEAVPLFEEQIDAMLRSYSSVADREVKEAAVTCLQRVRDRGYASCEGFREDFEVYLAALEGSYDRLPGYDSAAGVWAQALEMLSDDYWHRFLFDPDSDLASYRGRGR